MLKFIAVLLLGLSALSTQAEDLLSFKLSCANGVFTPRLLHVPAGRKFRIDIYNTGSQAIEFESTQLRKEKALSPGTSSFVVIYPLDPGEYKFFDDFHVQTGQGSIVAK